MCSRLLSFVDFVNSRRLRKESQELLGFEEAVDELLALDDGFNPYFGDLYEDELARRLGLERYALFSQQLWRKTRVAFINAHPEADRVAEEMEHEIEQSEREWSPKW